MRQKCSYCLLITSGMIVVAKCMSETTPALPSPHVPILRLLMRVDYAHELDFATIGLVFEHGQDSAVSMSDEASASSK